jgi:hypothetical protein
LSDKSICCEFLAVVPINSCAIQVRHIYTKFLFAVGLLGTENNHQNGVTRQFVMIFFWLQDAQ